MKKELENELAVFIAEQFTVLENALVFTVAVNIVAGIVQAVL